MQRRIPILAVVLGLQLAAGIALGLRNDSLEPTQPDTPLVAADLKDVNKLVIAGPQSTEKSKDKREIAQVELVKRGDRWLLPGYFDAPASAQRVQDLLQKLAETKRGLPVATTAASVKRFKVAEDEYERRLVASVGDKPTLTLYFGDSSGPRKSNARTAQDTAVYAVEVSTFDLPTGATDWFDQALLKLEANTLNEIEVAAEGKAPLTLLRSSAPASQAGSPPGWQVKDLSAGNGLDEKQATTLVDTIAALRVDAILGTEKKPEWRQEKPQLRLDLKNTKGKVATWTLSKPATGDTYVLKVSDQPWYFELKSWNARPLIDAAASEKLVH